MTIILLLFLTNLAYSNDTLKIVTDGMSIGIQEEVLAKEWAVAEALSLAMQSANLKLESQSILNNETELHEIIRIYSKGFVRDYRILNSGWVEKGIICKYKVSVESYIYPLECFENTGLSPALTLEVSGTNNTISNEIAKHLGYYLKSEGIVFKENAKKRVKINLTFDDANNMQNINALVTLMGFQSNVISKKLKSNHKSSDSQCNYINSIALIVHKIADFIIDSLKDVEISRSPFYIKLIKADNSELIKDAFERTSWINDYNLYKVEENIQYWSVECIRSPFALKYLMRNLGYRIFYSQGEHLFFIKDVEYAQQEPSAMLNYMNEEIVDEEVTSLQEKDSLIVEGKKEEQASNTYLILIIALSSTALLIALIAYLQKKGGK